MVRPEIQELVTSTRPEPSCSPSTNESPLAILLSLYPDARPVHIPIRVGLPFRTKGKCETTTITFRSRDAAFFLLNTPLIGGETVVLQPSAGPIHTPAVVVAVMPNGRASAVAARFHEGIPRWFLMA